MGVDAEIVLVSAEKVRRDSVKIVHEIKEGPGKGIKVTEVEPGDKIKYAGEGREKDVKIVYADGSTPPTFHGVRPSAPPVQVPVSMQMRAPAPQKTVIGHGLVNGMRTEYYAEDQKK